VGLRNGNCLKYDRYHWHDDFGMLGGARHTPEYDADCAREWAIEQITAEEFERVWEAVDSASNQPQRYTNNGDWPALRRIKRL
jgi:hypothetical protein